ncbi:hypothetical protein BDA96_10G075700 [Sorghum bicolor]|uniref:Uncharacterized protein n=1 Tax=Sorghum bicolor TaxID=4558 RepID=A0A921PZR1_SORBI|nr:hypothetical protein BDA96_10G075700 [Sorghum bicolor]
MRLRRECTPEMERRPVEQIQMPLEFVRYSELQTTLSVHEKHLLTLGRSKAFHHCGACRGHRTDHMLRIRRIRLL